MHCSALKCHFKNILVTVDVNSVHWGLFSAKDKVELLTRRCFLERHIAIEVYIVNVTGTVVLKSIVLREKKRFLQFG